MSHSDRDSLAGRDVAEKNLITILQLVLVWLPNVRFSPPKSATLAQQLSCTSSHTCFLVKILQRSLLIFNATAPLFCTLFVQFVARTVVLGGYSVAYPLQSLTSMGSSYATFGWCINYNLERLKGSVSPGQS